MADHRGKTIDESVTLNVDSIATLFRVLDDRDRVRLLQYLVNERTWAECVGLEGVLCRNVADHLEHLVDEGFVRIHRENDTWMCGLANRRVTDLLRLAEGFVHDNTDQLTTCSWAGDGHA